jgi:hypothetical protein
MCESCRANKARAVAAAVHLVQSIDFRSDPHGAVAAADLLDFGALNLRDAPADPDEREAEAVRVRAAFADRVATLDAETSGHVARTLDALADLASSLADAVRDAKRKRMDPDVIGYRTTEIPNGVRVEVVHGLNDDGTPRVLARFDMVGATTDDARDAADRAVAASAEMYGHGFDGPFNVPE